MNTLKEIMRETYGHDDRTINKHSTRTFQDETGNLFILSRTLDGCPPFFEAYGPYSPDHQGVLPRLRVAGKEYWGNGWSWRKAMMLFCHELKARIRKG
ncbi:MAG: hypothetical protein A2283_22085 [Lentisphaerae bacterium RIFOXYA12_FULL_48_11]|nr:MAG: hypothetical protein A2283_22085 [Lentisphaerae bacterium RIFOXYA12_FULL_48_11]